MDGMLYNTGEIHAAVQTITRQANALADSFRDRGNKIKIMLDSSHGDTAHANEDNLHAQQAFDQDIQDFIQELNENTLSGSDDVDTGDASSAAQMAAHL